MSEVRCRRSDVGGRVISSRLSVVGCQVQLLHALGELGALCDGSFLPNLPKLARDAPHAGQFLPFKQNKRRFSPSLCSVK
jgi:hypothetical protein